MFSAKIDQQKATPDKNKSVSSNALPESGEVGKAELSTDELKSVSGGFSISSGGDRPTES